MNKFSDFLQILKGVCESYKGSSNNCLQINTFVEVDSKVSVLDTVSLGATRHSIHEGRAWQRDGFTTGIEKQYGVLFIRVLKSVFNLKKECYTVELGVVDTVSCSDCTDDCKDRTRQQIRDDCSEVLNDILLILKSLELRTFEFNGEFQDLWVMPLTIPYLESKGYTLVNNGGIGNNCNKITDYINNDKFDIFYLSDDFAYSESIVYALTEFNICFDCYVKENKLIRRKKSYNKNGINVCC